LSLVKNHRLVVFYWIKLLTIDKIIKNSIIYDKYISLVSKEPAQGFLETKLMYSEKK